MSESILKWCDIFLWYIILHFSCLKIETSSFCPFSCFILLSLSSPFLPPCLNLSPTQGYVSSVLQSSSGERPSSGVSSMSSSISSRGQTRTHHTHLHIHANRHAHMHAHMHACIHTYTYTSYPISHTAYGISFMHLTAHSAIQFLSLSAL